LKSAFTYSEFQKAKINGLRKNYFEIFNFLKNTFHCIRNFRGVFFNRLLKFFGKTFD